MRLKVPSRDYVPLITGLAASIIATIPRFASGIPQGVDSTSHLGKIIFMFKWYNLLGHIPSWYPDWYGGTPFLLLYSPLSYFLTFAVAFVGMGPIVAYELVDTAFFAFTPLTVYVLGRELNLDTREAAWGSFLFALTPTVVGSFLFYDRFPNVVALPIACLFLTTLVRMFKGRSATRSLVASVILLSILILVHHLSALLALLIAILALVSFADSPRRIRRALPLFTVVLVGAAAVSSPWLANFIRAASQISENPFFNRNVQFAFIRLSYALSNYLIIEQGILHFVLAVVAIAIWLRKGVGNRLSLIVPIGVLFAGMFVFEFGETARELALMYGGQTIVVVALASVVALVLYNSKRVMEADCSGQFLALWFSTFFWLGLGYYAIPLAGLPVLHAVWRSLDVHRFWLYLSVPIALLAGKTVGHLARSAFRSRHFVFLGLALTVILVGAVAKAGYSITQDINPHLPYTTQNSGIPTELLTYLRLESEYGRILPVRCPLWVYVLPSYTEKSLIDGWYPQEKLLPALLRITDYRINDLETMSNRTQEWKKLLEQNQDLGIHWVLVGNANSTLLESLSNSTFRRDTFITYGRNNITVLKNTLENWPISLEMLGHANVNFCRLAPDRMLVDIRNPLRDVDLVVREAYHSGWSARIDGKAAAIESVNGLISVHVSEAPCRIIISHSNPSNPYVFLSLATIVLLMLIVLVPGAIAKKFVRDKP